MATSRISATLLRGGVSLAAMAAAWGLPQATQADSCTLGNTIQGLPQNTLVACPSSTELQFPGAIPQGAASVPNGSFLLSVIDGTDPTHQLWTYQDSAGNIENIFLSGQYLLRNGIGGATELQGGSLLDFSGAGLCGAGGLQCPGTSIPRSGYSNSSNVTGGGAQGGFIRTLAVDPFSPEGQRNLVERFAYVAPGDANATMCDAMPSGTSCTGGFRYGPETSAIQSDALNPTSGDLTITGTGFQDYQFDASLLPEDVAANLAACDVSGAASCAVVFNGDETPFFYGPAVTGEVFPRVDILPRVIVTGSDGFTAVTFPFVANFSEAPEGARYDIADLVGQHELNTDLIANQANNSTSPGGGVNPSFSLLGADDRFLITQDMAPSTGEPINYAIIYPVKAYRGYGLYDFSDVTETSIMGLYVDEASLPNVVATSPGRNADGNSPQTSFVLTFSAPMDTEAVEDNFVISSFTARALTLDGTSTVGQTDEVWDDNAFDVDWNSDNTEATFTFREDVLPKSDSGKPFVVIGIDNGQGAQQPRTQIGFQTPDPDPSSATATGFALALILGVYAEPDNGAQAAQMTDAVTAGVPTTDGERNAVDTTRLMFQPADVNVASSEPEIIGKVNERDTAGFLHERYVVRYPDGSLVAIDAAGQRVGPVTKFLGSYQVQREGGPLLAGMGPVVQEGANSFRIERLSSFIILPADQPAPSVGSLLPSATQSDLKAGSIVYDLQTKKPVGRVIDDQGHVELDNPSAYLPGGATPTLPFPIPENVKVNIPPPA